jgi:hypothetical protein
LFYFNTRARPAVYQHTVQGSGLDHCYDCLSEITILKQWILKNEPSLSDARLNERVAEESLRISRSLDTQRTLESGNADPGLRRAGIVRRQSIEGRPAYRVHTDARGFAVSEAVSSVQKHCSPDSPSLPPAKAQRMSESETGAIATSDHEACDCDRFAHREGAEPSPRGSTGAHAWDNRSSDRHLEPKSYGRDHSSHGGSERLQQHQPFDDLRSRHYRAQSSARFDVDKYSKMLGINSLDALSSNYAITAGSSSSSTRGLGFSASAGLSASYGRNEQPRDRPASQSSRPSNAHMFPDVSCFRRWLSVYLYSRIMQGPNRYLDLSLRPLLEVQDALAHCRPSVYIHGHVSSSVHTAVFSSPTAKEQEQLMQRFPSVVLKGFALNFCGKDGTAELSQLCSSCRTIAQIDVVDVGLLVADVVASEAALIPILDSFHSVCAPGAIMQGRTNCSISDFTRLCCVICYSCAVTHSLCVSGLFRCSPQKDGNCCLGARLSVTRSSFDHRARSRPQQFRQCERSLTARCFSCRVASQTQGYHE